MENKKVNIILDSENLVEMLINKTQGRIDRQLAELIVGNIRTSNIGLEQLARAMFDIYPKPKYDIGAEVYLAIDSLPGWLVNKSKTLNSEFCVKGIYIIARIMSIDIYNSLPYKVKYTALDDDGATKVFDNNIGEDDIKDVVESIEGNTSANKYLPF